MEESENNTEIEMKMNEAAEVEAVDEATADDDAMKAEPAAEATDSNDEPEESESAPRFASSDTSYEKFDVFHWANEVDEVKNNVSAELFLFNKNYTPYKIRYSDKLAGAVKAMFMQEAIHYVIEEADKGLECREYEKADGEERVIYHTNISKVGRAETLIHLIENEYKDIDYFSENEYDFKKVKGIIARFSYPGDTGMKSFYIAKLLPASSALKGATSWEINGESFEPFSAEIAIKMPEDNQVAIVGDTIVVFNQAKFENLFQYDYKSQVLAEEKAKELTEKYKLSFSEGLTLDSLLADKKPLLKKVQAMDIQEEMPQD
ncbi:hypothetical protein IJ135_02480, partial [Candidatus Saccharibacteria bacterium]|nr:hypothetical protein [Candidatus Saccharibacteria bacterium]